MIKAVFALNVILEETNLLLKSSGNKEAGDGFSDILIRIDDSDVGIVIEVKYSENGTGDIECRKAITQINQKKYADEFRENGAKTIWNMGLSVIKRSAGYWLKEIKLKKMEGTGILTYIKSQRQRNAAE